MYRRITMSNQLFIILCNNLDQILMRNNIYIKLKSLKSLCFVFSLCSRRHQHGRWLARIGSVAGNKDLYLGTLSE